jgi:hypothetical protein
LLFALDSHIANPAMAGKAVGNFSSPYPIPHLLIEPPNPAAGFAAALGAPAQVSVEARQNKPLHI